MNHTRTSSSAYVLDQMISKLYALSSAGNVMYTALKVDPDTDEVGMHGLDWFDYLKTLILEIKASPDEEATDVMLCLGGPTVWVRRYTPDKMWMMGTSSGLEEPLCFPFRAYRDRDAISAINRAISWSLDQDD